MAAELPPDIDALIEATVQRKLAELTAQPRSRRVAVFDAMLSGPQAGRDGVEAALRSAGFDVRRIDCPHGYDSSPAETGTDDDGSPVFETDEDRVARVDAEQSRAWLAVERVVGEKQPSADDQQALMDRITDAIGRFGFSIRMHGAAWARRNEGVS